MRLNCPLCGVRDVREFTYKGDALALARPDGTEWSPAWDDYLHNRDNPAGIMRELWHHHAGCTSWLVVERDLTNHAIHSVKLARGVDA